MSAVNATYDHKLVNLIAIMQASTNVHAKQSIPSWIHIHIYMCALCMTSINVSPHITMILARIIVRYSMRCQHSPGICPGEH